MRIKAILFDVDRTLVDVRDSYEQAVRLAAQEYLREKNIPARVSVSEDSLYRLWLKPQLADVWFLTFAVARFYAGGGRDFEEFVQLLLDAPGENQSEVIANALQKRKLENAEFDEKRCQELFQQRFLGGLYERDVLFPSVRETLATLKNKGVKLGVATARPRDEALTALNKLGLKQFFDDAAIKTLEDGSKAERINAALRALGALGEESAYVGDAPSDGIAVRKAKASGAEKLVFIGVRVPNANSELELEQEKDLLAQNAVFVARDLSKLLEVT